MENPRATESGQASDTRADIAQLAGELARRREALDVSGDAARLPLAEKYAHLSGPMPGDEERARREAERKALESRERLESRGKALRQAAGDRYAGCRLETFTASTPYQKQILKVVSEYVAEIGRRIANREGMVLYGPVGTGKDHLAYAVAVAAIMADLEVGWVNGQDWFGQLRDAMDSDRSESSIVGRIARPTLLVISDPVPPVGPLTQHQATMLYRAAESRYAAGKPTIVTVNVADDTEADERLGAATWDRLCHDAWKLRCQWPSYRRPSRDVKP